ncbi:MAG: DUF4198 domain-containing protein [Candidatus Eisenbacteria bacterium]
MRDLARAGRGLAQSERPVGTGGHGRSGTELSRVPAGRASLAFRPFALALTFVTLLPGAGLAHEHWFAPSRFTAAGREPVAICVRIGEGLCGPARPYRAVRTVRLLARTDRTLDLAPFASEGDTVWARFAAADGGGALVAWESNFVTHGMEGGRFDAYLEQEGLDSALALRRAARDTSAGRERYRRCSKLWLAGERGPVPSRAPKSPASPSKPLGPSRSAERATAALGLPLEIVPLDLPGEKSELTVRVLFAGRPLGGALVQAWHVPFAADGSPRICAEERIGVAAAWRGRTTADGVVRVPCAEAGQWLIGAVHMVRSSVPAEADWESTWASLGFGRAAIDVR